MPFLVDIEPDEGLDERKVGAQRRNDVVDPLRLATADFVGRHFSDEDRLPLGREERTDGREDLVEALPPEARDGGAPVVSIDAGPIDVRVSRVVAHRGGVRAIYVRYVRAPGPHAVG